MNFIFRLKERFSRFMVGRYGMDLLGRFLIWVWLFEAVLNLFVQSMYLSFVGTILCLIIFYRMFSKNLVKRRRENAAWYAFSQKVKSELHRLRVRIRDRKKFHFFHCPNCKAPIRMPRINGKFNVRCQKCSHSFTKEFK